MLKFLQEVGQTVRNPEQILLSLLAVVPVVEFCDLLVLVFFLESLQLSVQDRLGVELQVGADLTP